MNDTTITPAENFEATSAPIEAAPVAVKEKKPRKVKEAAPVSEVAGSNALDPDKRALFLKDKALVKG